MDLLDVAVLALRLALVAVLYGFLVIVLRSAGRSLQAARPTPAAEPVTRLPLRLIVLDPGGTDLRAGQAIDSADRLTLGRAERADLTLADATVSAEHARVSRAGTNWVVHDLHSTNGTLVNGVRVNHQTVLHHGDVLALGGVQFKITLHAAPADGGV